MHSVKAMHRISFIIVALVAVMTAPVWAHEFWVQPSGGPVAKGEEIVADIRRGQHFRGDRLVFNPANFDRFFVVGPSGERTVEGRLGDKPALRMPAVEEGLHVTVYVSDLKRTTYTSLEQFASFARSEGFEDAVERHRARDLPPVFSEAYRRYAKALVPVGRAEVPDRTLGLPIEIVLEDRPFEGGTVRARVFLHGRPMANALLRRFARPLADDAAEATEETARTDAWGRVTLTLPPAHRILLNAVHLREPDTATAAERNVAWETLWASSVFETGL